MDGLFVTKFEVLYPVTMHVFPQLIQNVKQFFSNIFNITTHKKANTNTKCRNLYFVASNSPASSHQMK